MPPPGFEPIPYYLPPARPQSLTIVSIVGLIFGILGVFCLAGLLVISELKTPTDITQISITDLILQISSAVVGMLLSTMLIIACIGALNLRPWSRVLLIVVSVVDVIFQIFKLALGFVYSIPHQMELMKNHPKPGVTPQQMEIIMSWGKIIGYTIAIIAFAVCIGYDIFVLLVMQRANVKAALSATVLPDQPST
jgi:hypothetical protein